MLEHVSIIFTLILLEGVLSADNALVLAVLVKHLPRKQQRKALLYGLGGAFLFRGVAILLARWILEIWWLQGLGALYLGYLAMAHFVRQQSPHSPDGAKTQNDFWRTVIAVELTDIAFAADSILVAVALTNRLWVIYTGAAIGIIAIRLVANALVRLLHRFPQIENTAYVLVGWISIKLLFATWEAFSATVLGRSHGHSMLPAWLFWAVMAAIVVLGGWYSFRHPQTTESPAGKYPPPEELPNPFPPKQD
jgi:YkoY family integral membrane protein